VLGGIDEPHRRGLLGEVYASFTDGAEDPHQQQQPPR
jgi:hypothetical protein